MKRFLVYLAIAVTPSAFGQTSPHGAMKQPCSDCHTTSSWRMRSDAAFDHAATKFPLTAQHVAVACRACHNDLRFSGASSSCRSCHTDVHRGEHSEASASDATTLARGA